MLKRSISVFLLMVSTAVYSQSIYLVESDSNQKFLLIESSPFNHTGELNSATLGLSFKSEKKSFNMKEAYQKTMARSNGAIDIPETMKDLYNFPSYQVDVYSEVKYLNFNKLEIISSTMLNTEGNVASLGSAHFTATQLPLRIDFDHVTEPSSQRYDYSEVREDVKKYSKSVFQIIGEAKEDGLGGAANETGTGFFITQSGYAMTNLHVMQAVPTCLKKRSCDLEIKQKDEIVKTYKVPTRVLTCSNLNDFCLLKLNLSDDIEILPLEMDLGSISKNLLTVGYPGDKNKSFEDVNGDETNETALTFSFGSPIGFSGTGISSSLFISQGASGSPIIDLESGKVVGLNSNGAQAFSAHKDGMPAIFRSLYVINSEFNLEGYLDNSKQLKIENLVSKLVKTNLVTDAKKILSKIKAEKSYYGRGKLDILSFNHESREIRKLIFKFLAETESAPM